MKIDVCDICEMPLKNVEKDQYPMVNASQFASILFYNFSIGNNIPAYCPTCAKGLLKSINDFSEKRKKEVEFLKV